MLLYTPVDLVIVVVVDNDDFSISKGIILLCRSSFIGRTLWPKIIAFLGL